MPRSLNLYELKGKDMTIASARTTQLLVVDDDPSTVRLLKKIIERQFEDEI